MTTAERVNFIEQRARADLAKILAEPEPERPRPDRPGYASAVQAYGRERAAWEAIQADARQSIVRIELAQWLGRRPSHSETTMFSRAYAAAEIGGRWARVQTAGGRTWGLKIK